MSNAPAVVEPPTRHDDINDDDDEPGVQGRIDHDDETAEDIPAVVIPKPPVGPHDPARMKITPQERAWAMDIKAAIEQTPEVDNVSDFWIVQLALFDQGNIDAALERALLLQEIRKEYDIVESFEFGRKTLHQAFDLYADFFLAFSYSMIEGSYVLVVDYAKQPTVKLLETHVEGVLLKLREVYYMNQILSADFESIRKGAILCAECNDVDISTGTKNVGLLRDVWRVIAACPAKLQKVKHFHTGLFSNILVSATKKNIPDELCSTLEVGCTCEAGSLDQLYLQPTVEAAHKRVLSRLEDSLRRRYHNDATFRL